MKNRTGFTLIEMAALLVLLGIMLGSLVGIYTRAFSGRSLQNQNKANVRGTKTIVAFAQINKYLPENINVLESIWRSNDTYGNDYEYIIAPNLTNKNNICSASDTTSISIRFCSDPACTSATVAAKPIPNIAFILLSRGRNSVADYILNNNEYRVLRNNEKNDDIPISYTISELKGLIGCENTDADENRLHFVNTDIVPLIINGTSSNASVIVADGGKPFGSGNYEWCVDEYEPLSVNFYALDMLFYVQNGASQTPLQRIADSSCSAGSFVKGGNKLWIKYGKVNTIDSKPSSFYFTAHLKDNDGTTIAQRFLFQMYQK